MGGGCRYHSNAILLRGYNPFAPERGSGEVLVVRSHSFYVLVLEMGKRL